MNGLRAALGADRFAAGWEQGRSLPQQEAIEEALAVRVVRAERETPTAELPPALHALTRRERDVPRLIVAGHINRLAAFRLDFSPDHSWRIQKNLGQIHNSEDVQNSLVRRR